MKPNNMKTVALASFMGVSLAACGSTPTREVYEVEQILEWYEHEGNLVIRVKSNGCSNEDSFYFYEPNARRGNQVELELVRSVADNCRRYVGEYLNSDTVIYSEEPDPNYRTGEAFPADRPVGLHQGALVSYPREWLRDYYNVPLSAEIEILNPVRPAEHTPVLEECNFLCRLGGGKDHGSRG